MGEEEGQATIVLDLGSGYTKVGFAGDDKPTSQFATIAGSPKSSSFNVTSVEGREVEALVGDHAVKHYSSLFINRVVDRGVISHWEDGERLLDYAYQKIGSSSDDHPLLVTEPPLASASGRERLVELVFETFEAPKFFLLNQSAASLYSIGRTTGVVVECGEGTVTSLPITEGFCCSHALHRSEFAGLDITKFMQRVVSPTPTFLKPDESNFYDYEKLKEAKCFVSLNPEMEGADDEEYELPDGKKVKLGKAKFLAAEAIFNPNYVLSDEIMDEYDEIIGQFSEIGKLKPLAEAVCESIATSEEEYPIRQTFFENIMLTGGTSSLNGFKERFLADMREQAPSEFEIDVLRNNAFEGDLVPGNLSTWIGGSIMACLHSTKERFLTRKEYDEQGVEAVFHKISLFE